MKLITNANKKIVILGIIIFFLILICGRLIYLSKQETGIAVEVAGQKISTEEYQFQLEKYKKFLGFTDQKDENPEKTIIDKLIEQKIIEIEAEKRGIAITGEEINGELQKLVHNYKDQAEFESVIMSTSGWTIEDVKKRIEDDLLKEKLTPFILSFRSGRMVYVRYDQMGMAGVEKITNPDEIEANAQERIKEWSDQISSGTSFEEIEKTIKPETDRQFVGKTEFTKMTYEESLFDPVVTKAIFALNENDVSGIIKSSGGYYAIIKIDEISQGNFKTWEDFFNDFKNRELIRIYLNLNKKD